MAPAADKHRDASRYSISAGASIQRLKRPPRWGAANVRSEHGQVQEGSASGDFGRGYLRLTAIMLRHKYPKRRGQPNILAFMLVDDAEVSDLFFGASPRDILSRSLLRENRLRPPTLKLMGTRRHQFSDQCNQGWRKSYGRPRRAFVPHAKAYNETPNIPTPLACPPGSFQEP
jgi:hypothetical protein